MTRRGFIAAPAALAFSAAAEERVAVPVHRVSDVLAKCPPARLKEFWSVIWPEAVRVFGSGGIELRTTDSQGEIRHTAGDKPIFTGLRRDSLNLVVTDHIPGAWDESRALAGLTTRYAGFHVCTIAVRFAHANRAPFLSVNTCVHELLHALLQDVYVNRPGMLQGGEREFRADWYATRLWLLHDGAAIRSSARAYLARLRAEAAA